jgi:excisionase family DNA binding protein
VAERLGLKPGTIRLWLAQRKIGSVKVGDRAVRIHESEIEKLIERGYTPAAPERAR